MPPDIDSYARAVSDAKLGAKAFQNILSSIAYFERMLAPEVQTDRQVLSALFCAAVVRYSKPFSHASDGKGNRAYPIKRLKKTLGFVPKVHEHLIGIRNTLVAHDDLESIEPRLLVLSYHVGAADVSVPVSISVANKCLAYPIDHSVVELMRNHAAACSEGIRAKLETDVARVRAEALRDPESANAASKYSPPRRPIDPNQSGTMRHPDYTDDPWFTPENPDFSDIHNGFRYDTLRFTREFHGTHRVILPDDGWIDVITEADPAPDAISRDSSTGANQASQ